MKYLLYVLTGLVALSVPVCLYAAIWIANEDLQGRLIGTAFAGFLFSCVLAPLALFTGEDDL